MEAVDEREMLGNGYFISCLEKWSGSGGVDAAIELLLRAVYPVSCVQKLPCLVHDIPGRFS